MDYNKVIKNRPLKMENKQVQIHIEKIKLLYQNSLIPIVLSGVAGLFLIAALWNSANHLHLLIWLVVTILFACIRVMLITKFQREKPESRAVLKVGSAIRHKSAGSIFMLERWFNLDYAAR